MCRLQNVFRFQSNILDDDLNGIDILGLSALIAFDPLLYEWVKGSRQFCWVFILEKSPKTAKRRLLPPSDASGAMLRRYKECYSACFHPCARVSALMSILPGGNGGYVTRAYLIVILLVGE